MIKEFSNFGSDDWDIPGEGLRFELKLKMTMKEARFYFKGTGFQIINFGKYVVVRGEAIRSRACIKLPTGESMRCLHTEIWKGDDGSVHCVKCQKVWNAEKEYDVYFESLEKKAREEIAKMKARIEEIDRSRSGVYARFAAGEITSQEVMQIFDKMMDEREKLESKIRFYEREVFGYDDEEE
jgi:hypothetical protein